MRPHATPPTTSLRIITTEVPGARVATLLNPLPGPERTFRLTELLTTAELPVVMLLPLGCVVLSRVT